MKQLNNYISEKLILNKNISGHKYHPKTREDLRNILEERLAEDKNANLNDIDVSNITDMGPDSGKNGLFEGLDPHNIDISEWNVSNVENMQYMFSDCYNFNADLNKWYVSNVINMSYMFRRCKNFNSDLSKWDVSKVRDMYAMFYDSIFNNDISKWDVSKVVDMRYMFSNSEFNSNISNWDVSNVKYMNSMFKDCPLEKNPPKWYKE